MNQNESDGFIEIDYEDEQMLIRVSTIQHVFCKTIKKLDDELDFYVTEITLKLGVDSEETISIYHKTFSQYEELKRKIQDFGKNAYVKM